MKDRGETAAFVGDLLATASHLPLPISWDMTWSRCARWRASAAFLRDAVAGSWRVVFEHDSKVAWGWLAPEGKGLALRNAQATG